MTNRLLGSRLYALCAALATVALLTSHACMAEYTNKDAVVILTEKNFEKEVLNSPDYWLVEFYAPWCGHCKNLEPHYKKAAKKLKTQARLGAVDATAHAALAQKYKIKGYPTIKEFGANKKKPRDYQGGRTAKDIVQYVSNSDEAKKLGVSGVTVDVVDFNTIQPFLAQDDKTPTAIIFGSQRKGKASAKPPSWVASLAQQHVKQVGEKKKTKTVPTVRFVFVPGNEEKIAKHFQIEDNLPAFVFIDETNERFDTASISDEAGAKKFVAGALKADAKARASWKAVPHFPAPEVAKKSPPVQLNKLSTQEISKCLRKKGKICVIVASDADADGKRVKDLAKKYRRDPFRFFAASKTDSAFANVARFFEASEASVLILKPGKAIKYAQFDGGNSDADLHGFLDRVIAGSTQFQASSRGIEELEKQLEATSQDHEEL